MVKKHLVSFILIGGFILRLALTTLNRSGDMSNHIAWTQNLLKYGASGFYERNFSAVIDPNYPPFMIYLFTISQWLFDATQHIIWWINVSVSFFPSEMVYVVRERFVLEAFYKLPAIFADMGIVWLVYLFTKSKKSSSHKIPLIAAALVAFNPAFFYNSAYWGQVESVPIFFMTAAFFSLLRLDRKLIAIVFVCLALLSKQTMAVFIPLWFLIWIKNYSSRDKLLSLFVAFLTFVIMFSPFHKNFWDFTYPFITYINKILLASGSTYVTNHAFNVWFIVTRGQNVQDTAPFLFNIQYRIWAFIISAIGVIGVFNILRKKKFSSATIFYGATLLSFVAFLLLPRVHERHFEPVLPFLLLLYIFTGKYLRFFIILSLFHFINLYHGWWQPEVPVLMPVLKLVFSPLWVLYIIIGVVICIFGIMMKDFVRYKEK